MIGKYTIPTPEQMEKLLAQVEALANSIRELEPALASLLYSYLYAISNGPSAIRLLLDHIEQFLRSPALTNNK